MQCLHQKRSRNSEIIVVNELQVVTDHQSAVRCKWSCPRAQTKPELLKIQARKLSTIQFNLKWQATCFAGFPLALQEYNTLKSLSVTVSLWGDHAIFSGLCCLQVVKYLCTNLLAFLEETNKTDEARRSCLIHYQKAGSERNKKKTAAEIEESETVRIPVCLQAANDVYCCLDHCPDQHSSMYTALMSCLPLLSACCCQYDNGSNATERWGFQRKFHSKLPFVAAPPLPHGDLGLQAEEKLAGLRAGRSPSNLCCYYSRAAREQLQVLHHVASPPFHFRATVLVMVNQGQPDINLKKFIFMLWTSFAAAGLLSKKRSFLLPKFVVFFTLLQTCDASSLQSCYWDCRYVAGRRWGRVLLKSKYERRQTDRWRGGTRGSTRRDSCSIV